MQAAAALRPLARAAFGAVLAWSALGAPTEAAKAAKPVAKPIATPKPDPVEEQALRVRGLAREKHRPAYAEGLLKLAALKRDAGDRRGALNAARESSDAFDTLVELHKTLSEGLHTYDEARAERAMALQLGLRRDEANFLVGDLAAALGEADIAIKHYIMVVQSQGDLPRGQEAYAALRRLGGATPPVPQGSARP